MKQSIISILLIEDNADDAFLIKEMLTELPESAGRFGVTHVERLAHGLERLEQEHFDIILLDFSLPDGHGVETFTQVQQEAPALPVVVLTGLDDEDMAVDALHEGAQDYLFKGEVNPSLLARAIRYAIERKRAEVVVAQSAADMEQFAYMVSTDMQQSLQIIAQQLAQLEERLGERIGTTSKTLIADIVSASQRVRALSDAQLAYTRTATWGVVLEAVDSQEILAQTLANLSSTIQEGKAEITHGLLPTVEGDTVQLLQLFRHLILNAIKFRSKSSPQIHIEAEHVSSEWVFSVQDNGIGIDVGYMERIFDPFQRLHKGDDHGVGIGLAICKRILDRHGGRIWVESKPNQGSIFYFTLPFSSSS
ncbi:MAG: ATP-binding protein [Chloroflexota bacterium]